MKMQGDPNQKGQPLTKREKQVAQALTVFDSEQEVANHLGISLRTMNFHTANIRAKLDANSTRRALLMLVSLGEITL